MRTGLETGIFPVGLLKKYKSLGLSDNDLLNVLAFFCTDVTMERAAKIRGYSNVGRMQAAMQHLFDKGLLINQNGEIDFSPLIAACTTKAQAGVFNLKPKEPPKQSKHYAAYDEVKDVVAENKHAWANFFKEMENDGYSLDDVIGCVKYSSSYFITVDAGKEIIRPVFISTIRRNIQIWIDNGRKPEYQPEEFNADEVMRLANAS